MRRLFLLFLGAAALAVPASAQMKSGDQMNHYAEVFGVSLRQPAYAYDIALIGSEPAANILAPGQQPVLTFLLTSHLDHPLRAAAKIDVLSYGTRGIPGDIWQSDLYKIADLPAVPIQVDLPAKGSQVIEIRPTLPEAFGAYAFVADLGEEAGRRFATSCVRAFAPDPAKVQYPRQALDDIGPAVLQGLGVKAIRMNFNYVPSTDKNYPAAMARLDAALREYAAKNITVMLMFLAGDGAPQPLGRGRPHLDGDGVMLRTKQDLAWLPESDADFRQVVAGLGRKYGWPRGPVTAMELWNEPWEGISISGWGADSVRYREIFTAMAHGVEDARADGAQILIAGCDSTSNTLDKLFGDGSDTYLKWLDVCSIHYQGLCAPVLFKSWLDRKGPNGRVRIWDTESWVANTADRVAAVVAADRAAGYDRAMGVYGGNIATPFQKKVALPDGASRDVSTYTVWPPAAAVAAAQHFMGEREFHGLLFRNGLPWVMVFDGLDKNPDDGTVVVVGDLHGQFGDLILFRDVKPAPGATLTVANPAGEFSLVDFYGNPVPAAGKSLTVPLDDRGFFLRANANGAPGSFARLVQAVSAARIDGIAPLSVQARDLLAPVDRKPSLRLALTNVLNRPVQGAVTLTLGDLALDAPKSLSFAPGETKEVAIPVTGGAARADNAYPLAFRFDAGADGAAALQENLHVNQIARRTVQVDGSLDDWKGALPQSVKASGDQGPSLMEAAWLPFAKFDASQKSGFATAFLGYDDKNFYFAAKIADDTPSPGTLRFATRDDDAYFYPEVSYEYDADKTLLQKEEAWSMPSRNAAALFLPGSKAERSCTMWSGVAGSFAADLALPEGAFHKVSFYFVDPDDYQAGRRRVLVDVQDAATGKSLAQRVVSEYGAGTYVSFRAAGKVRVVFRTQSWLPASLSAVFLDPDGDPKKGGAPASGAAAAWVANDLQTGAAWEGKYGTDGYRIAGAAPRLPAYATLAFPEVAQKVEHRWPEGVRRYSYRKRPELPFGSAPKFDNVQIAFNVIPADRKPDTVPFPPGTMPGFVPAPDTDYEYALNPVAPEYGGGTEVWRSFVPGMVRKHFYPRQPASPYDGPVKAAQLAFRQDGNTRIVECALPWSELPLVKKALDAGGTVKFSFRVNDDHGPSMELAQDRSVSRKNPNAFHPDWVEHWANQVEFSFEK